MDKGLTFYANGKYIYCQYYAEDGRVNTSAGIKVGDGKAERTRKRDLEATVDRYEKDCNRKGVPITAHGVENAILEYLGKRSVEHKVKDAFLVLFDRFVTEVKAGRILNKGKHYSKSWVDISACVRSAIADTPQANKSASHITEEDIGLLDAYLTGRTIDKAGNKAAKNTVATYIAVTVGILRKTRKLKWHSGPILDLEGHKTGMEDVDYGVYCSLAELEQFEALDTDTELRDLFILGCWIGTRFSDIIRLQPHNRTGDLVNINTLKTSKPVWVPMSGKAKEIWNRYKGNFPQPTRREFLAFTKDIGKMAGLNTPTLFSRTEGGRKIELWKPKYELMGTHTMRRSYATNAFLGGLDTLSIMKVTGHKTEKAFLRYIRLSSEEHAKHSQKHRFYN